MADRQHYKSAPGSLILHDPATPDPYVLGGRILESPEVHTMGKDITNNGTQQTQMDQYPAQSSVASLQKDPPGPSEKGAEPTGAQILAAIESSRHAMQTHIATIAVDVNLLRDDLRVVAERLVATEKQVTCLQSEMHMQKTSVAILEAKTHKLEARVEDAKGRARRRNLRIVGFP
ncbi:hypothetical protein NDU88_005672 [Pleurodeles waltl]|uniref:Uncharacterized protein n=1 Tax=Pleurodeles waltl TaxID=8319 RepID=A0AAV7MY93_PLEWA|nr:hypothetical protein NDU88_005672 [Pleurodeles waltl]